MRGKVCHAGLAVVVVACVAVAFLFVSIEADAKSMIIKFSDQANEQNPHYQADVHFAELVAQKTNGELEVQVFPSSQLGSARETLEGAQIGTVEMTKAAAGALSSFIPEFSVFSLPYVFTDREQVFAALDGKVGEILTQKLEDNGYQLIAYYDTGFRSIFNGKRPVNSVEDLKGLKIRVMNDPIMIDTVNTLGALATPLAYGELYTALQQGVVDGAEQPPVALYSMKFYEVSKYFSLTNHFYDLNVVVMGKMFFDKLSPEQQQAVLEAGQETQAYERKIWKEYEDGILDKLKAEGVEVNSLDLSPFQEAVAGILEQNKDNVGGAEFVETVLSYR